MGTAIAKAWARLDHKFDLITPSVPSSTGTSERVWKRESSPRPERIWLPLRRITKRSVSTLSRVRVRRKVRSIKHFSANTHNMVQTRIIRSLHCKDDYEWEMNKRF